MSVVEKRSDMFVDLSLNATSIVGFLIEYKLGLGSMCPCVCVCVCIELPNCVHYSRQGDLVLERESKGAIRRQKFI